MEARLLNENLNENSHNKFELQQLNQVAELEFSKVFMLFTGRCVDCVIAAGFTVRLLRQCGQES